jgi:hypothetical protein
MGIGQNSSFSPRPRVYFQVSPPRQVLAQPNMKVFIVFLLSTQHFQVRVGIVY